MFDHFQQFARFIVLAFHYADRPPGLGAHPLFDHREQDLLLFHHVAGEFLMQHGQVFGQPFRHVRFIGVDTFNLGGLQDQLRQLFAVPVVIADDDMVDNLREGRRAPVAGEGLLGQFRQLGFNHRDIQRFPRCGARQGLFAAAAVIHIVLTEQGGGARDGQRQLA